MFKIHKKECFFFIAEGKCMLSKSRCFGCSTYQKRIEQLDLKDHIALITARQANRASLIMSMLALLVSIASIGVDVMGAIINSQK